MAPTQNALKPIWTGDTPPASIQEVWDYIDFQLRMLKNKLMTKIEKVFYGSIDPIQYLIHVEEVFKHKHRTKRVKQEIPKLASLSDVEQLCRVTVADGKRPGLGVRDAGFSKDLRAYADSFKKTLKQVDELYDEVHDLFTLLHTYCRNYQSLEGEFDLKWARETNIELKNNLKGISELLSSAKNGINTRLYSSEKFSLEVAETCDCRRYPILRLFPDIFQKFHICLQMIGKWRAYDQIYLEDVQFKLIRIKRLLRLKQEEYTNLELEHGNILGNIVEKRVRVKLKEVNERIKLIDNEISRLHARRKSMLGEKGETEQTILDKKRLVYFDRETRDNKRDVEVLSKKMKSLAKGVKLNEKEVGVKEEERREFESELDRLRRMVSRSNQLAFERTELVKEMDILTEKVQELESILLRKTDRNKLSDAYDKAHDKI